MEPALRDRAMKLLINDLLIIRDRMTLTTRDGADLDRLKLWEIASMIAGAVEYANRIISNDVVSSGVVRMIGEWHPSDVSNYLACQRCGHTWLPRTGNPKFCPKCNSPYWNRERK